MPNLRNVLIAPSVTRHPTSTLSHPSDHASIMNAFSMNEWARGFHQSKLSTRPFAPGPISRRRVIAYSVTFPWDQEQPIPTPIFTPTTFSNSSIHKFGHGNSCFLNASLKLYVLIGIFMKIANVCLELYNFRQLHKNNLKDLKLGKFYQLPL